MPDVVLAGQAIREVELRLRASGAAWQASPEEYADDLMRLRVQPGTLGVLPVFPPGMVVDCTFGTASGRFYAEGMVARAEGPFVWLAISAAPLRAERRRTGRSVGGFSVVFWCEGVCGTGACTDIGTGGMRVRLPVPLPVGADLEISFLLPDGPTDVTVRGKVVYRSDDIPGEGCYLGVQFKQVSTSAQARIDKYCGTEPAAKT